MKEHPLMRAFMELRRHRFPLGVGEYLALLRALEAGFGTDSRASLIRMCSTLWAKSREEQGQIELIVDRMLLPDPRPAAPAARPAPVPPSVPPTTDPPGPAPAPADDPDDAAPTGDAPGREHAPGRDETEDDEYVGTDLVQLGAAPAWAVNPKFEFDPVQPIRPRRMKRTWRGYRRSGRSGPRVDFDVDRAVEQLHRQGRLVELPMIARRSNQARLLLLVDEGGSMVPFRYITEALLRAVRTSGLSRLDVRYFHDVPRDTVYRDPALRDGQRLVAAAAPFADQGILIYGDAGAARGHPDSARVEAGLEAVARLRAVSPTVVWLNPVPEARWRGSSAAALREQADLPMYPLSETGLRRAIGALHGKTG